MPLLTKPRIIYNDDSGSLRNVPQPHTPEQVHGAVDYLKETQVDVLCWCMTALCLAYSWPSKVMDKLHDKVSYDQKSRDLILGLHAQGIDYLPLLIKRAHANGLQFYASFRMNYAHHVSDPDGPVVSEFWKSHQDCRLWEVTNGLTYYNGCLDYSYPEVRDYYFHAIVEVAREYDVDGIEIDFCRNPYTFQPSEAWSKREILTDYFKKIRSALDEIAKEKGKTIGLMLRVPLKQEMLERAGMDVKTWVSKGLMDVLVMSNLANDYNLSVEPWLSLCKRHDILFYPSVEVATARHHEDASRIAPTLNRYLGGDHTRPWVDAFVKSTRAAAQNFWQQQADGIYMFNYPCALFDRINRLLEKDPHLVPLLKVLSEIGSETTVAPTDKLYYFYTDMPLLVQAYRPREYHQTVHFTIGDSRLDGENTHVSLWFREEVRDNPHVEGTHAHDDATSCERLKYYLNDWQIPFDYVTKTKQSAGTIWGFDIKDHDLVEISLPGDRFMRGENRLGFHIPHFPRKGDPYIYIYELDVEVEHQA